MTSRRSWLPVITLGGALLLALLWGVFGQIPIAVDGDAILIYPRRVVSFQSPASGQIISLDVQVGDFVRKGDVVGIINQPEIAQRLEQERVRLSELSVRNEASEALRARRRELQLQGLARKRDVLEERIAMLKASAERQRARNERYIAEQRSNLERVRRITLETSRALAERLESYRELQKEGLSSEDQVLSARERLSSNQLQAADLELRAQEIESRRLRAESEYRDQIERIADLEGELQQLAIQEAELEQQRVEAEADRTLQVSEVRRNIERFEEELRTRGRILSEFTGRVLELNVTSGQLVSAGERIGSVEAEDTDARLVAAAYFKVGDGKRIDGNSVISVSPATVERARFGSIVATVRSVSPFPVTVDAIANVVGSREIAAQLARQETRIQVLAELAHDPDTPSGYRWTSGVGPDISVTAGTTARVRATVQTRRPISFVIPVLRSWSGL